MGAMSSFEKFLVNRASERNADELLRMIGEGASSMTSGMNMLELGAGKGAFSYSLYQSYAPTRLVVTDYDPSQVSLAESRFREKLGSIPENVEIREVDAMSLPFVDESFDAVFASRVLHHVERRRWHFRNIPKALDEIHRVLKSDGLFVYEEIFNKPRIQAYLVTLGFDRVFEKRDWLGNRFYIFRKSRPPAGCSAGVAQFTGQPLVD